MGSLGQDFIGVQNFKSISTSSVFDYHCVAIRINKAKINIKIRILFCLHFHNIENSAVCLPVRSNTFTIFVRCLFPTRIFSFNFEWKRSVLVRNFMFVVISTRIGYFFREIVRDKISISVGYVSQFFNYSYTSLGLPLTFSCIICSFSKSSSQFIFVFNNKSGIGSGWIFYFDGISVGIDKSVFSTDVSCKKNCAYYINTTILIPCVFCFNQKKYRVCPVANYFRKSGMFWLVVLIDCIPTQLPSIFKNVQKEI